MKPVTATVNVHSYRQHGAQQGNRAVTQSGQTLGLHQFFISGKPQRRHFVDETNVLSSHSISSATLAALF